jgi:hypothetical protein
LNNCATASYCVNILVATRLTALFITLCCYSDFQEPENIKAERLAAGSPLYSLKKKSVDKKENSADRKNKLALVG